MSRTEVGEPSEAAATLDASSEGAPGDGAASESAAHDKPRRKRRKKRRTQEDAAAPIATATPTRDGISGTFYLAAAVTVIASLLVAMSILAPTEAPYATVVIAVGAFFTGANHPRPEGMLRVAMALAALGLAGLATSAAPWAIAASVAGGIGLGGAIHRLGREGPDDALQL